MKLEEIEDTLKKVLDEVRKIATDKNLQDSNSVLRAKIKLINLRSSVVTIYGAVKKAKAGLKTKKATIKREIIKQNPKAKRTDFDKDLVANHPDIIKKEAHIEYLENYVREVLEQLDQTLHVLSRILTKILEEEGTNGAQVL